MIDADGYRANVGIILVNQQGRLFWAKRVGQKNAWQFPQGGVDLNESTENAMFRELAEEIGLKRDDVEVVAATEGWLRYSLPKKYIRYHSKPLCIGQKQKWYLLKLITDEKNLRLDKSPKPEFDCYRWVNYWYPLKDVVPFKRRVYRLALKEFAGFVETTKNRHR